MNDDDDEDDCGGDSDDDGNCQGGLISRPTDDPCPVVLITIA